MENTKIFVEDYNVILKSNLKLAQKRFYLKSTFNYYYKN